MRPSCQDERQVVELRDEKFKSEAIQEKVHKLFRIFSINIHYKYFQEQACSQRGMCVVPPDELFNFQRDQEKKENHNENPSFYKVIMKLENEPDERT